MAGIDHEDRYNSVVVLGNSKYKNILKKLSGPRIKIITQADLTPISITQVVRKHQERSVGRTLWILAIGIYSVCETESHPNCSRLCKERLHALCAPAQMTESEIAEEVQNILFDTNKVCTAVQNELQSNGSILIVPPIPAVIVQESVFNDHLLLHDMCEMYATACAPDAVLFRLHIFFNILCDAWSNLAADWLPFKNKGIFQEFQDVYRGKNLVSVKSRDESYTFAESGWLLMVNTLMQVCLSDTEESSKLPISVRAGSESKVEGDVKLGNFKHCVIVGSSNIFDNLRDKVKDMSVSFLERAIDLDEEGLEILREEKVNYPENTVWIVVRGVSEIAELTDVSPQCEVEKCDDPLFVFVLKNTTGGHPEFQHLGVSEMIEKILDRAIDFAISTSEYLNVGSLVFLAPIVPVSAYFGGNGSEMSHKKLHDLADKDPSTPILSGSLEQWIFAVKELHIKWMEMISSTLDRSSPEFKVMNSFIKDLTSLVTFINAPGKPPELIRDQKLWGNTMKGIISVLLGLEVNTSEYMPENPIPESKKELPAQSLATSYESSHESLAKGYAYTQDMQNSMAKSSSHGSVTGIPSLSRSSQLPLLANPQFLPVGFQQNVNAVNVGLPYVPQSNYSYYDSVSQAVSGHGLQMCRYQPRNQKAGASRDQGALKDKGSKKPGTGDSQVMAHGYKSSDVELCKIHVTNMNTKFKEEHVKQIIEACGSVVKMDFPIKGNNRTVQLKAQYNNAKSAKRAARILNFLKVFGNQSLAKVPASKEKHTVVRELHTEDRLIIPIIQDVILQIQKAKAKAKQVSIAAKKLGVTTDADKDVDQPKEDVKGITKYIGAFVKAETVKIAPKKEVKTEPIIEEKPKPEEKVVDKIKPVTFVFIEKLSRFVAHDVMKRIVKVFGSVAISDVMHGKITCQFHSDVEAKCMVRVLNNLRLPDTKLKVYMHNQQKSVTVDDPSVEALKEQVNVILKQYGESIMDVMREEISKDVNYFTYKTQLCKLFSCKNTDLCHNYHNIKDRRRSPITSIYSSSVCKNAERGLCIDREACSLAHTSLEQQFHLINFRNKICEGVVSKGICNSRNKICSSSHPETPDMFYHGSWEDLYVEGYGETLKYLNGAIKNMFKLCNTTDLQVLVLCWSHEVVQQLTKTFQNLAKSCRQNVVAVSQYGSVASNGTVMIATPAGLLKMLNRKEQAYDMQKLRALIIDDGLKVFTDIMNAKDEKLSEILAKPDVNKVVIDDGISEGKVKVASNILKCTLKKLQVGRLVKKWEPTETADASKIKQEPSVTDRPTFTPAKKDFADNQTKDIFKVPSLPPPRIKSKESSDGKNEKDVNEKTAGANKSDANLPSALGDSAGKTDTGVNALKLLMSSYKDFQKVGNSEETSRQESSAGDRGKRKSRFSDMKQTKSTNDCTSDDSPSKPIEKKNLLPVYSFVNDKAYASIPFDYNEIGTVRPSQKSTNVKDFKRSRNERNNPQRSPQPSLRERINQGKRRRSPLPRPRHDDKRSYIGAEMDLKEDHAKQTKLFLDVPEVHPQFEEKYKIFSDRYEKQYPGKNDSTHKNQRWREFWKVIITGMQETEWREKIEMLKRQFKMLDPDKSGNKDNRGSAKRKSDAERDGRRSSKYVKDSKEDTDRRASKRDDRKVRSSDFQGNINKSSSRQDNSDRNRSRLSDRDRSLPSLLRETKDSSSLSKLTKFSEEFSISHAVNVIGEVCHLLGVLSPAMKIVLDNISKSGVDSKESANIIMENDNALLIEMCYKRFESLVKTSPRGPERKKLTEAAAQAKKLQEYAALKLKEIAIAAADNAVTAHKLSSASEGYSQKSFKTPKDPKQGASDESAKLVRGLDANKIARATYERGTEATIEFIKNAFAYEGMINPSKEAINEIYIEVSKLHFQMTLSGKIGGQQENPDIRAGSVSGSHPSLDSFSSHSGNMSFPSDHSSKDYCEPFAQGTSDKDSYQSYDPTYANYKEMYSSMSHSSSFSNNSSSTFPLGDASRDQRLRNFSPDSFSRSENESYQAQSSSARGWGSYGSDSNFSSQQDGVNAFLSDTPVREDTNFSALHGENVNPLRRGNQNIPSHQQQMTGYSEAEIRTSGFRDSENRYSEQKEKNDNTTLDFMNERLDFLLRDAKLQSSANADQRQSVEENPSKDNSLHNQARGFSRGQANITRNFDGRCMDYGDVNERNLDYGDMNERNMNYSDMNESGRRQGDFDEDQMNTNFEKGSYDDDQRDSHFEMGSYHQHTRPFASGNQYYDEQRRMEMFDDNVDLRATLSRKHRAGGDDDDNEIDIDRMRMRSREGYPRPHSQQLEGLHESNWGQESHLPQPRNNPGSSFDDSQRSSPVRGRRTKIDDITLQEFFKSFR